MDLPVLLFRVQGLQVVQVPLGEDGGFQPQNFGTQRTVLLLAEKEQPLAGTVAKSVGREVLLDEKNAGRAVVAARADCCLSWDAWAAGGLDLL